MADYYIPRCYRNIPGSYCSNRSGIWHNDEHIARRHNLPHFGTMRFSLTVLLRAFLGAANTPESGALVWFSFVLEVHGGKANSIYDRRSIYCRGSDRTLELQYRFDNVDRSLRSGTESRPPWVLLHQQEWYCSASRTRFASSLTLLGLWIRNTVSLKCAPSVWSACSVHSFCQPFVQWLAWEHRSTRGQSTPSSKVLGGTLNTSLRSDHTLPCDFHQWSASPQSVCSLCIWLTIWGTTFQSAQLFHL